MHLVEVEVCIWLCYWLGLWVICEADWLDWNAISAGFEMEERKNGRMKDGVQKDDVDLFNEPGRFVYAASRQPDAKPFAGWHFEDLDELFLDVLIIRPLRRDCWGRPSAGQCNRRPSSRRRSTVEVTWTAALSSHYHHSTTKIKQWFNSWFQEIIHVQMLYRYSNRFEFIWSVRQRSIWVRIWFE